jgi:Domain of unknown function (DUF1992)
MDILAKIAEQKIREAMERGEFDNLAFHGKPLRLDDLSGVPEALRMGYRILKNAGVLPPEMQLQKEILALQDLINACYDDDERRNMQHQLNEKTLRYNMMMERQVHKPAYIHSITLRSGRSSNSHPDSRRTARHAARATTVSRDSRLGACLYCGRAILWCPHGRVWRGGY